ncbi:hypothetical protein NPIL_262401 [Nephila pilipes]|uniref:Adenylate cyclase N-terminal domain-containing protein n=1 Tax=Nephila pilipes TaxID=299642 RepID=A0A8X6UEX3_NEPPI|nr:hypothetical protein NPIL_262401 [Nephila pilipes]
MMIVVRPFHQHSLKFVDIRCSSPSEVKNYVLTNGLLYTCINLVSMYTKYLTDRAQRNAFLETRRAIETRHKTAKENNKQERLLLSVLPRFVVLEMIRDMASDEDDEFHNNRKILSAQQFHRIYIHCYDHVRYVCNEFCY